MSDLIDREYMLSQIEKAKAENRPFDYDSLIDFVKVLPNANKAELEKIKAEIEADKRLWLLKEDVYEILDKRIKEIENE